MVLSLLLIAGAGGAFASSLRETSDFADVAAQVEALAKQYDASNVLVVSDLDNTLLAMDQDLGSDHWFEWQVYLLAAEPQSRDLVAPDFDGILKVQGILFDSLPMHPPQPEEPALVARMQQLGVKLIVLTARGDEFRRDAEDELTRNGYDVAKCALEVTNLPSAPTAAQSATFLPYRSDALSDAGISAEECERWHLPPTPKAISYQGGVCMVAGQHKGAMLRILLTRAVEQPKAIVYIDQDRQVRRVFDAVASAGYDVTAFDYQREDPKVRRFQYGEKATVTRQWQGIQEALEKPKAPAAQQSSAKAASTAVPAN